MGKIVQLSKHIINQIAAGEVIERPYSVVKELVENSIDAGSTRISVEICNDCRDIRVADNGSGISPDDIELAFSKHATSKISTCEDLYNINTLGFRGEALASIISISKLTCITRTKEFDYGTKAECQNSEVKYSKTGCAIGTIMDIKDLFFNLPVRLKFLKTAKTEYAYISEFMQAIALIHSDISFELKLNGKTTFKTAPSDNQLLSIKEIFSPDIASNLKQVLNTDKLSNLNISGYISTPDYTRASKKDYYLYVNSRLVKCPVFQKAIDMVYRNLTGGSKYPFIVLNLEIPPADVDVNVHPSKREVKYKNPNQIFNFIYASIDSALKNREKIIPQKPEIKEYQKPQKIQNESAYVYEDVNISDIFSSEKKEAVDNQVTPLTLVKHTPNEFKSSSPVQSKLIDTPTYTQEDVIIGQYQKTYILIEKENGLEIVDQHIAEERYIYEKLKENKNIDCQLLFISDVIPISVTDKNILDTNKDKLSKFGYEIDFISDTEVIFRKIPQILSKIAPKEILADILENISGDIDNIEEKILITTSCKAAVKANTYLNQYQMEEIIRNWRTCKNPETCPHGRPISKFFEHKDIAKFFERNK
ncbi:MAG: DNA mismatch repair endonuclease MutL [bacterium]|nr:DNA mismatch repair endonuclease MutL [bacterium]